MSEVAQLFDSQKTEYDILSDLWYSWVFSRLHYFIAEHVLFPENPYDVLDVGCGTGFQSFLHAAAGSRVVGIDISSGLIEIARMKAETFDADDLNLFPAFFDYVHKYNHIIRKNVRLARQNRNYQPPQFKVGDATTCPYQSARFDHINCCGSVLSFIPDYPKAIREMVRLLRPGGTFFFEVEAKWNFNVLWYLIDPFLKGKIGLNRNLRQALNLFRKPLSSYRFDLEGWGKLHLFTKYQFLRELKAYGLRVTRTWSLHSVPNIIPSAWLENLNPSRRLIKWFTILAHVEENLPFYLPGSSLVVYGKKI